MLKRDDKAIKNFNNLNVLHNYFDSTNKILFSDLYLAKLLNTSAKPFFPCFFGNFNGISLAILFLKNINFNC